MIQWQPLTQATRFQRTAWSNAFSVCSAMQLKGKEMLEDSLNQCFWLTEKDKQGYLSWAKSCLETTENLQSMMDKGFQEVEKQLSDQPPAASASKEKPSTIASLVLAATQGSPNVISPAKKKPASKRSTARSKSSSEVQVKKKAVSQKKPAATKTAKKSAPATKTTAAATHPSDPPAQPAASQQNPAGKERTAEKQAPAKTKESSGAVPKQTP